MSDPQEQPKKPNFPAKGPRKRDARIIPAHRQIFENYKEQGFRSLGKAIRRTGVYSEAVASRVNLITKSVSWQTLMNEYMPEETLAQRHSELLNKRDTEIVYDYVKAGKDKKGNQKFKKVARFIDKGPETNAVSKGLELAYRLRGSFQKEEAPAQSTVMYNLFYKPEVREQVKMFEDSLKLTLLNEINKKNLADSAAEDENNALLRGDGESVGGEGPPAGGGGEEKSGGSAG